jgi:predicted Zn finger-like uncharacterized protein
MRINCPSCNATYEVPDTLLGAAARRVRCARCAHEWTPEQPAPQAAPPPPAPPPAAPPPPPPEPEPAVERPAAPRPRPVPRVDADPPPSLRAPPHQGSIMGHVAVITLSVVALAALGWAAYVWRAELMLIWPPSQRLFAAIGLA